MGPGRAGRDGAPDLRRPPPGAAGGPGRPDPRRPGPGLRRHRAQLRGAGPGGEPAGPGAHRARRRARAHRRRGPAPLRRPGHRADRGAQDGGRVSAPGPGLPGRAAGVHARRRKPRPRRHPRRQHRGAPRAPRCGTAAAGRRGHHGHPGRGRRFRSGGGDRPRAPRVHHLHLGLHRPPQGRPGAPPGRRQLPGVDAGRLRPHLRGPDAAEDPGRVRRLGLRVLPAAAQRRDPGGRQARRPQGPGVSGAHGARTGHHRAPVRTVHAPGVPRRPGRRRRVRGHPAAGLQRR